MATGIRKPRQSSSDRIVVDGFRGVYGALGYRSVRIAASEGRGYHLYSGSAHEERDRPRLIGQSRDFYNNNPIYEGMIERMVSYIIGNGFPLQAIGPKAQVIKAEKLWKDWIKKPEIRGLLSGDETAKMVMRELFVAGDTLALKTDKGLIQLFEAEQIDGDKSYPYGIKKNKFGAPVMFHLCPWKASGIDKKNGRGVPAADVLFLTNPKRPSQIRGVPACQASFAMLHRVNDICDSEAIAWQLLSRLAVAIERQEGPAMAYTESKEDPNISSDDKEGKLSTRMTELGYALMFHANPGEKITGIERNIPGKNFTESIRMFLRLLGLPIGCPLELILLDWTQSNYSQSRAVLEQAHENFSALQKKMINSFYGPLFDWKMAAWRSSGMIGKKADIQATWITPSFPWLDLLKEVQAYATKVERGFTTHSQVCKSLKTDRDEVIDQREKEVRDAIERSKKIEIDTEVAVPWQIFAGMEPPGSKPASPAEPDKDEPAAVKKKEKEEDD